MDGVEQKIEIQDAAAYVEALQILNKKSRPPAVLRLLMNAFESYRQARKIGWSRPWNKYGVTTHRSYRLNPAADNDLIVMTLALLDQAGASEDARKFYEELLSADPRHRGQLMGFIFFQELHDTGSVREAVTLSFGRVSKKRYRDRVDIVFEADISDGKAGPLTRLRIYVDPFLGMAPPLWEVTQAAANLPGAAAAFDRLCTIYGDWESDAERLWDHWTSAYIDYFGARSVYARNTHFPASSHDAARLMAATVT